MADPTLKDVARLAKVHPGTASRALDPERSSLVLPETRKRVLAAAQKLGYRGNAMARGLRTGRSGIIAVVVAAVGNPFLPLVLVGIEEQVTAAGYILIISETHDREGQLKNITDRLSARQVDALIICAAHLHDTELVAELGKVMPVILAVRNLPASNLHAVVHDDVLGGRLAAQYLVDMGHIQVAQLQGSDHVSSFVGRSQGFREVMTDHPEVFDATMNMRAAEPTVAEGRRLMNLMLDHLPRADWPTAVFAHNDMLAVGALDAMAGHGLACPNDISLVGYNDSSLTPHMAPPLTTIRLPSGDLGRQAGQLALAAIDGTAGDPGTVLLPPELVVRASVRRRRRAPKRATQSG